MRAQSRPSLRSHAAVRTAAVLTCLAVGLVALLAAGAVDRPGDDRRASGRLLDGGAAASGLVLAAQQDDPSRPPGQTSEGIPGETAEPLEPGATLGRVRIAKERSRKLAPGVHYKRWDRIDRRGRVRLHLLRVDPKAKGVSLDYATGTLVPERRPLTTLLEADAAIAGVNGGFFDIYDTGAPLGVGVDRERGFLHSSYYTWNNTFSLSRRGVPAIGKLQAVATIAEYPQVEISNINSPRVREAKAGIYTAEWGSTMGDRITDGQTRNVRMVLIQDGVVVANRTTLTKGKQIEGVVLVGRGPSAEQLAELRVGTAATVTWKLPGRHRMAISGEKVLVRDGKRKVREDTQLHPRTAVGIDRKGRVMLLVADGRSEKSRGLTLKELAKRLQEEGAVDALNLDGGGSTTMAAVNAKGNLRVTNNPSDGDQRSIPDGIAVTVRGRG
ncbi:phosphodiester glycosidase family protein [Nocardioides sp. GCM10027113]|uniref:phosphodiester glycosidase family protein n=1 Tax=unclassified Nocardioides TaxID=2615069 RepID=UPI00361EDBBA